MEFGNEEGFDPWSFIGDIISTAAVGAITAELTGGDWKDGAMAGAAAGAGANLYGQYSQPTQPATQATAGTTVQPDDKATTQNIEAQPTGLLDQKNQAAKYNMIGNLVSGTMQGAGSYLAAREAEKAQEKQWKRQQEAKKKTYTPAGLLSPQTIQFADRTEFYQPPVADFRVRK